MFLMASLTPITTRALAVPELVLEIVSHLDQAELTLAALVCREWRALTETLLYRAVSVPSRGLDEDWSARSFSSLARTLAARPELAQRVKALQLWCPSPEHAPQGAARLLVLCRAVERLDCIGQSTKGCRADRAGQGCVAHPQPVCLLQRRTTPRARPSERSSP